MTGEGGCPDTLRIGLLGPLQLRDEAGHSIHVGGRQLRVLLILLALEAGRVVPSGSLADQIWPEELSANPGNALQTLVSRLRAELRRASLDHVIESHPAARCTLRAVRPRRSRFTIRPASCWADGSASIPRLSSSRCTCASCTVRRGTPRS